MNRRWNAAIQVLLAFGVGLAIGRDLFPALVVIGCLQAMYFAWLAGGWYVDGCY